MSRSTPPAQPVIMPATITIGSEASICQATSQPAMVNTTSPIASSTRNATLSRCTSRAIRMVTKRRNRRQREIGRVLHPDQRIVPEQDIADGAAAERGDAAEHADAGPIHAAPARRQRRRHRLRRQRHMNDKTCRTISLGGKAPHRTLLEHLEPGIAGSIMNRLQD